MLTKFKTFNQEEGFSLMEVLMTVSIMGILSSIPIASGIQQHKAATQDVQEVQNHQQQVEQLLSEYDMAD